MHQQTGKCQIMQLRTVNCTEKSRSSEIKKLTYPDPYATITFSSRQVDVNIQENIIYCLHQHIVDKNKELT